MSQILLPNAVFLDLDTTSRGDLDMSRLEAACNTLRYWPATALGQRLHHIGDAEVVISNKVVLDAALLQALSPQVKLVCIAATGTNNVDLVAAARLGIAVTNIRDYASQSVAEHTIALLFALARQLTAYDRIMQQGAWQKSPQFTLLDYPVTELAGKVFGLIGYGALGQATANLARALGMEILVAERLEAEQIRPGRVSLDELLARADVLSLHCPLTEQTRHLINAERLHAMRPSAFLINTARGGIVHEGDLLLALQEGWIAGAALDVLEQEPPHADHPLLQNGLPNLIITPHIAWASRKARQTLIDQLADVLESWSDPKRTLLNQLGASSAPAPKLTLNTHH
ncbi:MAG: glycerate dehydrogenase [Proteobacteria bacterium]|nr:MAG: glycerate dehydrogenase [Pseudomonadota bacterium]